MVPIKDFTASHADLSGVYQTDMQLFPRSADFLVSHFIIMPLKIEKHCTKSGQDWGFLVVCFFQVASQMKALSRVFVVKVVDVRTPLGTLGCARVR